MCGSRIATVRVLEQEGAAGGRVRNAQRISRPALWILTPAAITASGFVYLHSYPRWAVLHSVLLTALIAVSACLVLSCLDQRRFWWAPRVIAGLISLGLLSAFLLAGFMPFPVKSDRFPPLFMATLAFLLWGLPALCFVLWGHTSAKLGRRDATRVTFMDIWTSRVLVVLYYTGVFTVCLYLLHQVYIDMLPDSR
jgi:hypothetical protein